MKVDGCGRETFGSRFFAWKGNSFLQFYTFYAKEMHKKYRRSSRNINGRVNRKKECFGRKRRNGEAKRVQKQDFFEKSMNKLPNF